MGGGEKMPKNNIQEIREATRIAANTYFKDLERLKDIIEARQKLATAIYYHNQNDKGSIALLMLHNKQICEFLGIPQVHSGI
jgi:hypothetical protein